VMMEKSVLRWVIAVCILSTCASAFASDRAEPNAFLSKRAESVSQLIQQVNTDTEVADRYERHFGKSKEDLVHFLGGLHLARLNAAGTYRIYSVDSRGVIKAHPERLKAGARVFADASGMPVLKASCGNAMVPGSNDQSTALLPSVTQPSQSLEDVGLTTPVSNEADAKLLAIGVPGMPVALAPEMPGLVTTGNSNQSFVVPAALAAIGGAGSFLFGSKGGAPVPEPATILVVSGAIAALVYRRKAK